MILTRQQFNDYANSLSYLSLDMRTRLANDLWQVWEGTRDVDAVRDAATRLGTVYAEQYHNANASVANSLWEQIFKNDTGKRMEALVAQSDNIGDRVARTASRVFTVPEDMDIDDEWVVDSIRKADDRFARYAHEGARLSMIFNTERAYERGAKKARWARVPVGATTCAFCVLLASHGFYYLSEQSALYKENGDKFHDCCDCEVVPAFSDEAGVIGFDSDMYLDQYKDAIAQDSKGRVDLNGTLKNMRQQYGYH